jgi:hypothetical protein
MTPFRRALGRFAALWLVFQLTTLAAAPAVFWTTSHVEPVECTCVHGDHAICPMHHKSAAAMRLCLMQDADTADVAVLTSLLGHAGVLPLALPAIAPVAAYHVVLDAASGPLDRPVSFDPPPPRS